jgi:hypothetical protein
MERNSLLKIEKKAIGMTLSQLFDGSVKKSHFAVTMRARFLKIEN